jgi:hypothetical protein
MKLPDDRQTFCIYCQVEFRSPRRLVNHLKQEHLGTYAYINLVPKAEQ